MYVSHKRSRSSSFRRRPQSRFSKKVARVISSRTPLKKVIQQYATPPGAAGTQIFLTPNILSVINTSPFFRVTAGTSGTLAAVGGDSAAVYFNAVGDTVNGNVIYPKMLTMRGVMRNTVFHPASVVRMYFVRYGQGVAAPTTTNFFMGLTSLCKLVDKVNYRNYTVLAQKDFHMKNCQHIGNAYLPQSKPGGTANTYATGATWDTTGVGILGNTNTTYITENLAYFNANTMSGSYAPHTLPFIWKIPLSKRVRKVVYNEGAPTTGSAGDVVAPSGTIKDWTYAILGYSYINGLQSSNPAVANITFDEFMFETSFKNV